MNMQQYQEKFVGFLANVNATGENRIKFLLWMRETVDDLLRDMEHSNVDAILEQIQDDLRETLPVNAQLPTEHIIVPDYGQGDGCHTTVHVDGFLYPEEEVDRLCDEGKLSRNYCTKCTSTKLAPLNYISHSMSRMQLKYVFQHLLPDLNGKSLLDVGSRTGAVLYAAYLYSSVSSVIGVEINAEFCQLQQTVVDKYHMQERVQVINDDISNQLAVIQAADVVVLNNVFEYFLEPDLQTRLTVSDCVCDRMWQFLRSALNKPDTLVVMSPSLHQSLKPLQTGIQPELWMVEVDTSEQRASAYTRLFCSRGSDSQELDQLHLYRVL